MTPTSRGQPVSSSSAARYAAAADRLDDTHALLHGLHRRHKNQHRVSTYWWPAFGQLRRNVRRLAAEVRDVREARAVDAAASHAVQRAVARARMMREQLVPKAYL